MVNHTGERFEKAKEKGSIINKEGYHQCRNCSCRLTTRKGAYRDVTIELDGKKFHFYHQNLVVKEKGDKFILDSCGFKTKTTKERINRYIPKGYTVYQEDFKWYVEKPNGNVEKFKNGMELKR